MTSIKSFISALVISMTVGCSSDVVIDSDECINELSKAEKSQGWRSLFDGVSLDQWRSYGEVAVNSGWGIESGCIARLVWGGDLITKEQFANFELRLEWRISDSGNSGIFIRGDERGDSLSQTALEMQVLDNYGHWDRHDPKHRAGAYYDMIAPDHDTSRPVGFWNRVYILARGEHVEFWLNGRQTSSFNQGDSEWKALYEQSKFAKRPRYGNLKVGHIGLQDHWDKVWYRALRIRVLDNGILPIGPN